MTVMSRIMQRSSSRNTLRIHIHTSSQVLFDGFYITLQGSFVNWDVCRFPTPHDQYGCDDCDQL